VGQTVPQLRQLFTSVARSVQAPAQHAGIVPVVQEFPQAAQLVVVFRATQLPLQQPWPLAHPQVAVL
jgi:hypothetical protein